MGRATETQPASEHEPALSYGAPPRQESASASPGTQLVYTKQGSEGLGWPGPTAGGMLRAPGSARTRPPQRDSRQELGTVFLPFSYQERDR